MNKSESRTRQRRSNLNLSASGSLYEIESSEQLSELNLESHGLGERYMSVLRQNLGKILQVDPMIPRAETCGSVCERSVKLAEAIIGYNVNPQDIVMIVSRGHIDQTVSILGCLFAGAVVSLIDSTTTSFDFKEIVLKLNPKMIFFDLRNFSLYYNQLKATKLKIVFVVYTKEKGDAVCFHSLMHRAYNPFFQAVKITEPKITSAFIICTPGTTGPVKLVNISHYSVLYQTTCLMRYFLKDVKSVMSFFPNFWHFQILVICASFEASFTKIITDKFQERNLCRTIRDLKVECIIINPIEAYHVCTNIIQDYDISSLKRILVGSSYICSSVITMLCSVFTKCQIISWYSLSEVGIVSFFEINDIEETFKNNFSRGELLPGNKIRIIDTTSNFTLPSNQIGEILINSPSVMLGYVCNISLSKFKDNYYVSGDVGYYDDGHKLYIKGRVGDMICREGSIFFPMDIENFVFTCPYVSNVTAVINENEIVLCVITTEEAPKILEESLMKSIKDKLPMERWPSRIKYVDVFPETSIGTIKIFELKETALKKVSIVKSNSIEDI